MALYYVLAAIVIWLGLKSLLSGFRFAAYVRRECTSTLPEFTPFASIIAPCRGLHRNLKENMAALFVQDYPAYEIIFVTDVPGDPCSGIINDLRKEFASRGIPTSFVFAGPATDSGQKVHNLREAVTRIDSRSEAIAFVDADARPGNTWLRSLVTPLQYESVGATTGYRWFLPIRGGFSSQLLSLWNASIASALGEQSDKNFCWGGSTAIRRSTFERLQMRQRWRGTVSDDFTLMRVLREAKLPIRFVPACLIASFEDYDFHQLLEFTTRQLQITRVYAPHFWRAALIGGLLFNSVFFGGIVIVIVDIVLGRSFFIPLLLVGTVFFLGAAKAYIRLRAVAIPLARYGDEMRKTLVPHVSLWPIGALLFFYNAIVAVLSRRIVWRGIGYELKSPTEAVIISRK